MKVAVLGSGGGGCAAAYDFAAHGHEVRLFDFPEFKANIAAAVENGGITAEGDLEGFAEIHYAGHDIKKTLDGAELAVAVGPAYSTRPFAEASKPYLRKGVTVIVCPSSCGGTPRRRHKAPGIDQPPLRNLEVHLHRHIPGQI